MDWNFFKICNGRCFSLLQRLDHHNIFNCSAKCVAGKTLCIGYADILQEMAERCFKCGDFSICTSAPCRCICLMGHEQQFIGIVLFFKVMLFFHLFNEFFHFRCQVIHINIKGVIGAVGHVGAKNFSLPPHSPCPCHGCLFNDKTHCPASKDCSVPVRIKGLCSF